MSNNKAEATWHPNPQPRPEDGPDYHAELDAWRNRKPHDSQEDAS